MKAFKSRTVWLGIVITILGALQAIAPNLPINPLYQALFDILLGILIIVIRFDTKDAISDK